METDTPTTEPRNIDIKELFETSMKSHQDLFAVIVNLIQRIEKLEQ